VEVDSCNTIKGIENDKMRRIFNEWSIITGNQEI